MERSGTLGAKTVKGKPRTGRGKTTASLRNRSRALCAEPRSRLCGRALCAEPRSRGLVSFRPVLLGPVDQPSRSCSSARFNGLSLRPDRGRLPAATERGASALRWRAPPGRRLEFLHLRTPRPEWRVTETKEVAGRGYKFSHYCPVKSRIESAGWGHRVSFRGSRTAARPVKWAFSRKG